MRCKVCGSENGPGEIVCPACGARAEPPASPDVYAHWQPPSAAETRRLVKLGQCPRCHFMLFPADAACSACGLAINRESEQGSVADVWQRAFMPAMGVLTVAGLLAILYFVLR